MFNQKTQIIGAIPTQAPTLITDIPNYRLEEGNAVADNGDTWSAPYLIHSVTFVEAFAAGSTPIVTLTIGGYTLNQDQIYCAAVNVTNTGFDLYVKLAAQPTAGVISYYYRATGKKA